ncbi:hypothetical protein NGB36_03545 [Streptomyces sp. RB6PN25]|uniref:Uncharacterized protein n=1 Tax=Streptomyces humicola TaxID=2953240 RepID=A0ABT1PPU6_9ACTN|nr:hypothetical protein [Streptomyces humicola]MCQ4079694.1 hypothetical protein [Streptomyces humicola]
MLTPIAAAVLGLGTAWSLYPNGGVTIGHATALAMGPVVLTATRRWKQGRMCLAFLALWLLAAALTEVIVHDPLGHMVYALCRPLTVALSFCAGMWAFQQHDKVKNTYIVSLAVGLVGGIAFVSTAGLEADPWKYGYGPVGSLGAVLLSATLQSRGKRVLAASVMLAVALLNVELGFRSEFLIDSLAGAVGVLASRGGSGTAWKRCMLIGASICALAGVIYVSYGHIASSGRLGVQQEAKWDAQSHIEGGALLGARPAFVASSAVIEDSPLAGRGVAPQVSRETQAAFMEKMDAIGVTVHEGLTHYYFSRGLFLHSVLFQLWAETGILVLPGLLFPVLLVLWALIAAVRAGSGPAALIFSLAVGRLGWDLLFSPWPRLQGVYLGTAAAAAVIYLRAVP